VTEIKVIAIHKTIVVTG